MDAPPRLELSALGTPRVVAAGAPLAIERRKALALLVYLAHTRQLHSRDALAALLWPERDRSGSRSALRRLLWELNTAIGKGWLEIDRSSAQLKTDAGFVYDVDQFRALLAAAQAHEHEHQLCAECLRAHSAAAALYRGDFLAGFTLRDSRAFDDWQFFQSEQLRRELSGTLQALVNHHSATNEFEPAIEYARRWLELDRLHEAAHRHLIQLYAWSGQRAAALRQFEDCQRTLRQELNVAPAEATTRLFASIRQAPQRVAYLRVVSGPGAPVGERFVLGEATSIGFGRRNNDIHLEDGYVSKQHARVAHNAGRYTLRDLGSTNGTKVEGTRLAANEPQALAPGAEIQIGQTRLLFEYADPAALDQTGAVHETLQME